MDKSTPPCGIRGELWVVVGCIILSIFALVM